MDRIVLLLLLCLQVFLLVTASPPPPRSQLSPDQVEGIRAQYREKRSYRHFRPGGGAVLGLAGPELVEEAAIEQPPPPPVTEVRGINVQHKKKRPRNCSRRAGGCGALGSLGPELVTQPPPPPVIQVRGISVQHKKKRPRNCSRRAGGCGAFGRLGPPPVTQPPPPPVIQTSEVTGLPGLPGLRRFRLGSGSSIMQP